MSIYTDAFWDAEADKLTNTNQILKLPWEGNSYNQKTKIARPIIYIYPDDNYDARKRVNTKKSIYKYMVEGIYKKQAQRYGFHFDLKVKFITYEERGKISNSFWSKYNTPMRILNSAANQDSETTPYWRGDNPKIIFPYAIVKPTSDYHTAYEIAHENLHAMIFKAIFHVFGFDLLKRYINGYYLEYGDISGHFYNNNIDNLNKDARTLTVPWDSQTYSDKLQQHEVIVRRHYELLRAFLGDKEAPAPVLLHPNDDKY